MEFFRTFFGTALISLALLMKPLYASAQSDLSRPNILFAISDDQSFVHTGYAGCTFVETPAFDRIAADGILFTNAYTPNAKCAPSRSCILTGLNSWQLKAAANHVPYFPPMFSSYVEVLEEFDGLSLFALEWALQGPHFLVAGPAASGKTALLHAAALAAALAVALLAPAPATAQVGETPLGDVPVLVGLVDGDVLGARHLGYLHRARGAHPREVVAHQVDDHHVLGPVLARRLQRDLGSVGGGGIELVPADRALDGTRQHPPARAAQEELGRQTGHGPVPHVEEAGERQDRHGGEGADDRGQKGDDPDR